MSKPIGVYDPNKFVKCIVCGKPILGVWRGSKKPVRKKHEECVNHRGNIA